MGGTTNLTPAFPLSFATLADLSAAVAANGGQSLGPAVSVAGELHVWDAPSGAYVFATFAKTSGSIGVDTTASIAGVTGGVCPIGDSITEFLTGGIHHRICIQSKQRRRWGKSFGVAGDTTTKMLARVDALIAARPSIAPIQGGSNDILAGITESTTIANIDAIVMRLLASGIQPEIWAIPPRNAYPSQTKRINYRLMDLAARRGIPGYDPWGPITDPANGGILAAYDFGDGLHINGAGYSVAAAYGAGLVQYNRNAQLPVYDDAIGLVANGLFLANNGTVGTGWTVDGTPSIVAGDLGSAQKMDYSLSTGAQSILSPSFTLPGSANKCALLARVKFAPADSGSSFQIYVGTTPFFIGNYKNMHSGAIDGVLYIEFSPGAPVNTTKSIKFEVTPVTDTVATTGSIEVSQVDVINLTSLAGISPS